MHESKALCKTSDVSGPAHPALRSSRRLFRLPGGLVAALLMAGFGFGVIPSQVPQVLAATTIGGVVFTQPGGSTPTSFQLRRLNGAMATINVSTSTDILRRYGAPTNVTALSVGDRLTLAGTVEPGNTVFDATRARDQSIQAADAYARGTVTSVNAGANSFVFHVTNAAPGSPLAGSVTVDLAAGASIHLPNGTTETIGDLQTGDAVFVRGIYDRTLRTLSQVDAIRVTARVTRPTSIGGVITTQPGSSVPTTFELRRQNGATTTITVSSSTTVVRRYGAHTTVSAFTVGDHVILAGSFESGISAFGAIHIRDLSIQAASGFVRGAIVSVNASADSFVFRVTAAPYGGLVSASVTVDLTAGQLIHLPNGSTVTISSLQVGDVVSARGVFDSASRTLTQLDAISVVRQVAQPIPVSIRLSGFAYRGHHYAVVLVHATGNVPVRVALRLSQRNIWLTGRTGPGGYYQAQLVIGRGRWWTPHLVHATAYVYASRTVTASTAASIA